MAAEQKVTFCRICEPLCGMVATVEHGRLTQLRPDPDHPLSRGYACPKGIAMAEVQNDPDRVTHPLRRAADGSFERVSWDEALGDIGRRLRALLDERGPGSVGWYFGNPGAFSYSHTLWTKGFLDAIGSPHYYSAGSQDVNNRFAASALLYGSPLVVPIPDLRRTKLLVMIGANPLVSHGSVLSAPRIREQLNEIERVVVVDPRRTETARHYEHLPVRPDSDAWLLLALIHVVFEEGLADRAFLERWADGADALERAAAEHPPEATEARTGIPAERVRELARAFATADGAAAYGRTGSCLGRFGTLVAFLIDALNTVTGNLDSPGGAVFGRPPVSLDDVGERIGLDTYGKIRSRFGGFPDVLGNLPAALLPREIETAGELQIRALFVSAGNPVLSVPDGDALERALGSLELMVSLDFYVNETNKHADYVLPATTLYEREDVPLAFLGFFTQPFIQVTDAVVPPAGEARQEWEIIDAIARRIGVAPYSVPAFRALAKAGVRLTPRRLVDLLLRTGPRGDLYGLRRSGLSLAKLRGRPHGVVLDEHIETGVLRRKLRTPRKRLQLAPPEIAGELRRLGSANGDDPEYPLRMIGLRELRSHNSWMHNAPLLMRGGRTHALRVHPDDALAIGVEDGGSAVLESKSGSLTVPVKVTDEMTPGTVALPHGWGHRGGWQLANRNAGANVNLLASSDPADLERLAGMAHLNGIPVRLSPVATAAPELAAATAPAPPP
ncbi:MAG TPA: molybdopterin-dependent oxidoreductase [Thermoleophilaceae bacterium]|jgi:formate dehydrogenase